MAINFRRHEIMEKLGIEAVSSPSVELEEPIPHVHHEEIMPIRAQQVFGLARAPPASIMEEARDQAINPDGPMCDMTVPARKCPTCEANGLTTWVMPGKECPRCNSVVD